MSKQPRTPKQIKEFANAANDALFNESNYFATAFADIFKATESGEVYQKPMQGGLFRAVKRSFNGRTYEQMELDTPKAVSIATLLIDSDIFSCLTMQDGEFGIDMGAIISHLVRKNLLNQFFYTVLTHEDGSVVDPNEFNGKFAEFVPFGLGCLRDFFTLNQQSLSTIGMLLMGGLGISTVGGQFVGMLLRGANAFGLSQKDGPKGT